MDVTKIAQDVQAWIRDQAVAVGDDLTQIEAIVVPLMRLITAQVMEGLLAERPLGYEGSSRACACGGRQKFVDHRSKRILTTTGSVQLKRAYYHCRVCGASCCPHDEQAGLDEGGFSVALVQQATLLGVHVPFALAQQMLVSLIGQRVPGRTIERMVHRVGGVASREEASQAARMATWDAPACDLLPSAQIPHTLYIAVDGVQMNHLDGWHEVRNAAVYWDDAQGRRHVRHVSRRATAEEFKAYVWSLASRCGVDRAQRVVLLGDGAKWIWQHIGSVLDERTIHIVDWYHAAEHLWDCGRVINEAGTRLCGWVEPLKELLYNGDVREVLKRLRAQRARTRKAVHREALAVLITYLSNQDDRLAYDRFRAWGLDIGSGVVEAACKHVVAVRMKRNGMRWSDAGGQATLSLRVSYLNGQWATFWSQKPLRKAA